MCLFSGSWKMLLSSLKCLTLKILSGGCWFTYFLIPEVERTLLILPPTSSFSIFAISSWNITRRFIHFHHHLWSPHKWFSSQYFQPCLITQETAIRIQLLSFVTRPWTVYTFLPSCRTELPSLYGWLLTCISSFAPYSDHQM